jgi:hypothetical protein
MRSLYCPGLDKPISPTDRSPPPEGYTWDERSFRDQSDASSLVRLSALTRTVMACTTVGSCVQPPDASGPRWTAAATASRARAVRPATLRQLVNHGSAGERSQAFAGCLCRLHATERDTRGSRPRTATTRAPLDQTSGGSSLTGGESRPRVEPRWAM